MAVSNIVKHNITRCTTHGGIFSMPSPSARHYNIIMLHVLLGKIIDTLCLGTCVCTEINLSTYSGL